MADNALAPERDERGQFIQGSTGNPLGRPKGARNKLGEAFVQALHESFEAHGPDAIQRVIDEKPEQYLKVIASLCPKELNLNVNNDAEDLSDDEIRARIRSFASRIAPFLGGDGALGAGAEAEGIEAIATRVH
jgi:hypothetical protein